LFAVVGFSSLFLHMALNKVEISINNKELADVFASDNSFLLNIDSNLTEDEIIVLICDRVKELIDTDLDLLMSYLYRLDIPESRVNGALRSTNKIPLYQSLGLMIYYRQVERIRTKKKYRQSPIDGWEY
jgi:hypothetical protein